MSMSMRFYLTSAYPGTEGQAPLWRVPMTGYTWAKQNGQGEDPTEGRAVGDTVAFGKGDDIALKSLTFGRHQVTDAADTAAPAHDGTVVRISWPGSRTIEEPESPKNKSVETTLVELTEAWDTVKNIEVTSIDTKGLAIHNFVDTRVDLSDNANHVIRIDNAKRGTVSTEGGDDRIKITYASNEYQWSNKFKVETGAGNDSVEIHPQAKANLPVSTSTATFNAHPELAFAEINLGNGNDLAITHEASGTISGENGNDTIRFFGGNIHAFGGAGRDTITASVSSQFDPASQPEGNKPSSSIVDGGAGRDTITVYDGPGAEDFHISILIRKNETGHSVGTADEVTIGHSSSNGDFVAGDLGKLDFDLIGYSEGSSARVLHRGVNTLLEVRDAASNDVDMIKLVGQPIGTVDELKIHFVDAITEI